MRKIALVTALFAVLFMIPLSASAVPPEVRADFEEEFPYGFDDWLTEECVLRGIPAGDIYSEGRFSVRVTVFYDKDFEFRRIKAHVQGLDQFWAPENGTHVVNRYNWTRTVDGETEKLRGLHSGGQLRIPGVGVIWMNTGLEIVDLEAEEVIARHGRQGEGDPVDALCSALAG